MESVIRILGVIVLMVTPCNVSAQGQDWAVLIEEGRVVHAQTFNTNEIIGSNTIYGRETVFNVLFQGKMWMCWHRYTKGFTMDDHKFFCMESNKEKE